MMMMMARFERRALDFSFLHVAAADREEPSYTPCLPGVTPRPYLYPFITKNPVNPIIVCSHKVPQEGTVQKVCEGRIEYVPYNYTMAY